MGFIDLYLNCRYKASRITSFITFLNVTVADLGGGAVGARPPLKSFNQP